MSLLNGILGQIADNVDVENLAAKIGIPPAIAEQAIQALGAAHFEPGDTAEGAAASTGLPVDKIQEIIGHIGGEGSLERFAGLLRDPGGANLLGDLASGLFGKK